MSPNILVLLFICVFIEEKLFQASDVTINGYYSNLKSKIRDALQKKIEDERLNLCEITGHLKILFHGENIASIIRDADTIEKLFQELDDHTMWNYSDTFKLFNLAKHFLHGNKMIMKKIEDYRIDCVAHEKCTKICNWIKEHPEADPLLENPRSYRLQIRKQVILKFFNIDKIHKKTLRYFGEILEQLPGFEMRDLVMDEIRKGCIEVVWYIPTAAAQLLLNNIQKAASTFQDSDISIVYLEGAVIFDCAGSQKASKSVRFTLISELYFY